MSEDHTPKDYLDNIDAEDGFVPLICSKCKEVFRGWKLKVKCRLCAVPDFPKGVRHITHVAVVYKEVVYSLAAPDRHHHVLRVIYNAHKSCTKNKQGFLDNEGVYVSRQEALEIALSANQVLDISSLRANQLFSEDLW